MTHPAPTPVQIALILAIASLTVMANATISPSLPGLAEAFSDTPNIQTLAGLVLSLPSLAIVLTAALFGVLLDRVSWKRMLNAALVFYGIGGAAAALMDSMMGILASRLVLGLGVAATMTTVSMLAAQLFEGPARDRFMGWQAGAMSAGGVVFILMGGALAEIDWRAPFLAYLAALPLAAAMAVVFRSLPARFAQTDGEAGDASRLPRADLALGMSLGFMSMAIFYLIPTKLPFHLLSLGVTSPALMAAAVAGVTLSATPGALFFGALRARFGSTLIFAFSFAAMSLGYVTIGYSNGFGMALAGTILAGLGLGPMMPNIMAVLMSRMPPALRGRAAGLATTSFFAGQFAAPLLAGALTEPFGLAGVFGIYGAALMVFAAVSVASAVLRRPTRARNV